METIKIKVYLKDLTNIIITKEAFQGFYGGYIWAEGCGLSEDLLHVCENEIYLQNTRFGYKGERKEITSLESLLDEILVKDTEDTGCWSDEKPWDDIKTSDGSTIENMSQLIDRIGLISNIVKIEANQEFIDDEEYLESDDPHSTSMNEIIDVSIYKGTM